MCFIFFIVHRQVGQAAGIVKLDSDSGVQLSLSGGTGEMGQGDGTGGWDGVGGGGGGWDGGGGAGRGDGTVGGNPTSEGDENSTGGGKREGWKWDSLT